mmetsp:Transcript_17475/g.29019  ORF Transcript_17475/g.29019 Transcript_17475/m.29019 type:complete len:534 (-) Transcript_17475:26-1627(-)
MGVLCLLPSLLISFCSTLTLGFMIRPIDRLKHLRTHSRDGSFGPLGATNFDDELCPIEPLAESAMTSTFAEGTPEDDIILTWEPDLAEEIKENLAKRSADGRPYMIAVIGIPGSGKTTSCFSLSDLLDDCFVLPFDGYHLAMEELEKSPNSEDLIYRRGAPDTFDPARLDKDLGRIRDSSEPIIQIPGFDHSLGDPEPNAHEFNRDQHKVVLCEGLYLLHDDEQWDSLKKRFDMSIFVEANVDVCVERLKIRNLCIPGYTEEEIIVRVDLVDRTNAETVEKSKQYATRCVESAAQRSMTTTIADGTPETDIEVSWEEGVAAKIRKDLETRSADEPYMVSIVGGPGSGKTTSCGVLLDLLEDLGCMMIPFDGYHYPMRELQKMPNATDLIYRRGAPDTFDAAKLKKDLERIRSGTSETIIRTPGFDHAVGDPAPDEHEFDRTKHRVVLCEGLYLLHDEDEWKSVNEIFDYSIFVNADVDACIERLKIRNKCIPGYTEEEIETRCEVVDRTNAMIVDKSKSRASKVVESAAQHHH